MSPNKTWIELQKFHLVPAASSTSLVFIPIRSKIIESSFIKEILISRCVFSITFAASATFILEALYIPALIIAPYTFAISSHDSAESPETIFKIFSSVFLCLLDLFFLENNPNENLLEILN